METQGKAREMARKYAWEQLELMRMNKPHYSGRRSEYKAFCQEIKAIGDRMKANDALYRAGMDEYGDAFYQAVEAERMEIGRVVFGYDNK